MPQTAHRLDAADLPEHGTYSLRRALDGLAAPWRRLAADQTPARWAPEDAPRPGPSALNGRGRRRPSP
jgi:hypothetical protein